LASAPNRHRRQLDDLAEFDGVAEFGTERRNDLLCQSIAQSTVWGEDTVGTGFRVESERSLSSVSVMILMSGRTERAYTMSRSRRLRLTSSSRFGNESGSESMSIAGF